MNRIKKEALRKLEQRHVAVYAALNEAQENLDRARAMKLGPDVVAQHEKEVAVLHEERTDIETGLEPLRREAEQDITRWRANIATCIAVASVLFQVAQWMVR